MDLPEKVISRLLAIFFILSLLCGCAQKNARENQVAYYPDCREPLDYIAHRGGMGKAVGKGALQGGIIGLLSAAVYGAITGRGDPVHIAGSVGAGAAVGGAMGAMNHASSKEDVSRLSEYLEQIDGDISGINDVTQAGATVSMQCYAKKFAQLLERMKQGQIADAGAKARFGEIIQGREEAAALLGQPPDTGKYEMEFNQALGK